MSITRAFVDYLAEGSFDTLTPDVIERSKELILDTIGVAIAGARLPSGEKVTAYVEKQGGAPLAAVLGTAVRTAPPLAALANGTCAHAADYDDTDLPHLYHPSCAIVPAILAIGEPRGVSGRDLIEAHVLAFEAASRLSDAMPGLLHRGWHSTGVLGTMVAAAAAAKISGLDRGQTASALGIACSMASGLLASFGTHTKSLHAGLAAKNGVLAAGLAAEGFTGNDAVFDHRHGFLNVYSGPETADPAAAEEAFRDRTSFRMVDPGIGVKLSPCGSVSLALIPCTIRLATSHDIKPEDVERIELGRTRDAAFIAPFDDPKNAAEAQYSLTHSLAAALVRRRALLREFSEEAVHDPVIAGIRKRVHHFIDPDLDALPTRWDVAACSISIHLRDGRIFSGSQRRPDAYHGGPPMTKQQLLEKFHDCLDHRGLPTEQATRAAELIGRLEEVEDIREVMATLTLPA